jgi:hypothetical protein
MEHFKFETKREINSLSQQELIKKLGEVNLQLMKGDFEKSRLQNPYGVTDVKGKVTSRYHMKKLRYIKCLIVTRLSKMKL